MELMELPKYWNGLVHCSIFCVLSDACFIYGCITWVSYLDHYCVYTKVLPNVAT